MTYLHKPQKMTRMKKNFLITLALIISVSSFTFAQVSSQPETPKNYKPNPKELLPMPGELSEADVFPVLGKYEYINNNGDTSEINITRDAENKGVVWVNGMMLGRFKADLKASPCTYKIPGQKTLQNEHSTEVEEIENVSSSTSPTKKPVRFSGKSVPAGTMIFDIETSKLFLNLGAGFDEKNPTKIFPELVNETDELQTEATKKNISKNKKAPKSTTYILTKKISDPTVAPQSEN